MTGSELLWAGGRKIGEFCFEAAAGDLELERLGALLFQGMTGTESLAFAKTLATDDWDTIKMRQDAIGDLLRSPGLTEALGRLLTLVEEIEVYSKGVKDNALGLEVDAFDALTDSIKKAVFNFESYISKQATDVLEELGANNRYAYFLRGVLFKYELLKRYAEAMKLLCDTFSQISVQSDALRLLKAWAEAKYIQDNVDGIRAKLSETDTWWKGLGAFAIDVFMDARMMIRSLEVAEIRPRPYEKNGMLDGKPQELRDGIASLLRYPQSGLGSWYQEYILNEVGYEDRKELLRLRGDVFKWKCTGHDELVSMKDALIFYLSAVRMAVRFSERGVPVCAPERSDIAVFDITDAYLPEMALHGAELPVANNCFLRAEGYVNLITGPNSSGKTCYIMLAGQLLWLTQLGCLLPCRTAAIRPCDCLLTLFAAGESAEGEDSRMGMEVIRLGEITGRMTSHSLLLLNEPMTATSANEGIQICIELVSELIARKVSAMMVTHFGDIYELLTGRLAQDGLADRLTSLVMATAGDGELSYLYKIIEAPPLRSSYARAVIGRLGVTLGDMLKRMDSLGMDARPHDRAWDLIKRGEVL